MIWLTNKWAQIGGLVVFVISYLMIRDKRTRDKLNAKNEANDNEKANYVRRRVGAIKRVRDDRIEYRD